MPFTVVTAYLFTRLSLHRLLSRCTYAFCCLQQVLGRSRENIPGGSNMIPPDEFVHRSRVLLNMHSFLQTLPSPRPVSARTCAAEALIHLHESISSIARVPPRRASVLPYLSVHPSQNHTQRARFGCRFRDRADCLTAGSPALRRATYGHLAL